MRLEEATYGRKGGRWKIAIILQSANKIAFSVLEARMNFDRLLLLLENCRDDSMPRRCSGNVNVVVYVSCCLS